MTRKHFETIAAVIREAAALNVLTETEARIIAGMFATALKQHNANLDRERFVRAVTE